MGVKTKLMDDVAVIRIHGSLMDCEESEQLQEEVVNLVDRNIHKVVIDFAKVKWINSHGVGSLFKCYESVQHAGGKIGVTNISSRVFEVMSITKVHLLFDHFDNVSHAVKGINYNTSKENTN